MSIWICCTFLLCDFYICDILIARAYQLIMHCVNYEITWYLTLRRQSLARLCFYIVTIETLAKHSFDCGPLQIRIMIYYPEESSNGKLS